MGKQLDTAVMTEAWDTADLDQSGTISDEFSECIGKNRQ